MAEGSAASELEARQLAILGRIEALSSKLAALHAENSSSAPTSSLASGNGGLVAGVPPVPLGEGSDLQSKLESELQKRGLSEFEFKRVPSDYYEWTLEARRDVLSSPSVSHLCKSIVLKNTQAPANVTDCSNPKNSLYYVVVVQYEAKLNTEKIRSFVHSLSEGAVPKKRYNMRLAPEEESNALTGFQYNAVSPVGMNTPIPIILSDLIPKLEPRFFWMGGGEVDLKLKLGIDDFIRSYTPFIVDCT